MTWNSLDYSAAWHLRHVPRWVAIASNRRQSVAEHEHGVMLISRFLLDWHESGDLPEFRLQVFEYALGHDREEALTGDHPSPTKPAEVQVSNQSQARVLVKCADILEAMVFVVEEEAMGNRRLAVVRNYIEQRLEVWQRGLRLKPAKQHLDMTRAVCDLVVPSLGFPLVQAMNGAKLSEA